MFSAIVVGTDGSPTAARAVAHAAMLTKVSNAALYVVRAYRIGTHDEAERQEDVERDLHHDILALAGDGIEAEAYARVGPASDVILDLARWKEADLIVMGNGGTHGARRILGSVSNSVSHHAPCTVLLVPAVTARS
ncbi:MAG TPA: universal stress protein [Acidimicrobiales bacterium]|nr:universal stress protein [Acidimicrobiales bacterium]